MPKSIKINADITGFKKDILGLGRAIKDVSDRHKLQILDKESREFLEKGFDRALNGMKKHTEDLLRRNEEINKVLKAGTAEEKARIKLERESITNLKKIAETEKDITRLKREQQAISRESSRSGQFMGGLRQGTGGLLSKIPGIGKLGGMGILGGAGAMLGGGLMAGGAAAMARGVQGFNLFDAGKQQRIDLMGRGFRGTDVSGMNEELQGLGLRPGQVRAMRMEMTDVFGREGAGDKDIRGLQGTARGLGIDPSQITGAVRGVRAQAGIGAAQKTFAQLQATLMATELKGSIGPFLDTAAQMLTQINEDGIGLEGAALGALSNLVNQGVGGSEQRIANTLTGLDQSIRGATGERAAFFMSALAGEGIGAGTIGGAQLGMQMGLFGGGAEDLRQEGLLSPGEIKELEGQGIAGGDEMFRRRAGAISGKFREVAGGQSVAAQMLIANQLTGKSGTEGLRAMRLMEKAADPQTSKENRKKIQKELNEMGKPVEERMLSNLEEINNSISGQLDISQSLKEAGLEQLGERVAPIAITINELLAVTDKGMSQIIKLLGGKTDEEKAMEKFKSGQMSLEDFKALSPEQKKNVEKQVRSHLEARIAEGGNIDQRITDAESLGRRTGGGRSGRLGFAEAERLKKEKEGMEKTEKLWLEMLTELKAMRKATQAKTNTHSRGQASTNPGNG